MLKKKKRKKKKDKDVDAFVPIKIIDTRDGKAMCLFGILCAAPLESIVIR